MKFAIAMLLLKIRKDTAEKKLAEYKDNVARVIRGYAERSQK